MKHLDYYLDTEFHEFEKPVKRFGITFGTVPTIDFISIGIVSEDDREYYAVSNEFDLKAAWNNVWLRQNVLKSIHANLYELEGTYGKQNFLGLIDFSLKGMKNLLRWHGKSRVTIANEIKVFTRGPVGEDAVFYGYYSDYDWVVFCWLFGRMIDLPKHFPMYCKDLKQTLDEAMEKKRNNGPLHRSRAPLETYINQIKKHPHYPKQIDEHNALGDAKWNKSLHWFLNNVV